MPPNKYKTHTFSLSDDELDIVLHEDEKHGLGNKSAALRLIIHDYKNRHQAQPSEVPDERDTRGSA